MSEFVEVKSICSQCGGRCCKNNPGIYAGGEVKGFNNRIGKDLGIVVDMVMNPLIMPQMIPDFFSLPSEIFELTTKEYGLIQSADLENKQEGSICSFILALRPLGIHDTVGVVNTKYITAGEEHGNQCRYLTPTGCKYDLNDRPWECKVLKPNKSFSCGGKNKFGYLGVELLESWIPYQKELRKCFKQYVSSLDADAIDEQMHRDDDLFGAMLEEKFLGMYIDKTGRVQFTE